jgi:hypothetical protein
LFIALLLFSILNIFFGRPLVTISVSEPTLFNSFFIQNYTFITEAAFELKNQTKIFSVDTMPTLQDALSRLYEKQHFLHAVTGYKN